MIESHDLMARPRTTRARMMGPQDTRVHDASPVSTRAHGAIPVIESRDLRTRPRRTRDRMTQSTSKEITRSPFVVAQGIGIACESRGDSRRSMQEKERGQRKGEVVYR